MSEGEQKVVTWCASNNVEYEKEKTFEDCRNPLTNKKLRFDFYFRHKNIIAEVDGEQHTKKTDQWWDSDQKYQERVARDKIKDEYCAKNNIQLIRIPFSHLGMIERYLKAYLLPLPPVQK